jgi:hypothetical protein
MTTRWARRLLPYSIAAYWTIDRHDQAAANGWIIVDMKKEWKQVFPAK